MRTPFLRAPRLPLLLLILVGSVPRPVHADLSAARAYFELAEFEVALSIVDDDLRDPASADLTPDDLRDSHVLRGRCLVLLSRTEEAVHAFCQALEGDATWMPDPTAFSTRELSVFRRADAQCRQPAPDGIGTGLPSVADSSPPWYQRRRTFGAAVALVATAVLVWATGNDDEPAGTIPSFPDPPENPAP